MISLLVQLVLIAVIVLLLVFTMPNETGYIDNSKDKAIILILKIQGVNLTRFFISVKLTTLW